MGSILLWSTLQEATLIGSTYYLWATLLGLTLQGVTKLNLAVANLAGDNLVDGNLSTGNLAGGNITLLASDVCNLFCAMLQYLTNKGRLELLKTMKVIKSMSSSISFMYLLIQFMN